MTSKKLIFYFASFFLLIISFYFFFPTPTYAICPVCTVAVGAGLGISRALGIDDAVTSIWIGGLILSMSYWLTDWLTRKKFNFIKKINPEYLDLIVIALMFILVLLPLWYGKYIGRTTNTILGIDKILFGTALGSLVFLAGKALDKRVREVKGKQLFVYQKVVFPVISLLLTSLILDLVITKI